MTNGQKKELAGQVIAIAFGLGFIVVGLFVPKMISVPNANVSIIVFTLVGIGFLLIVTGLTGCAEVLENRGRKAQPRRKDYRISMFDG